MFHKQEKAEIIFHSKSIELKTSANLTSENTACAFGAASVKVLRISSNSWYKLHKKRKKIEF